MRWLWILLAAAVSASCTGGPVDRTGDRVRGPRGASDAGAGDAASTVPELVRPVATAEAPAPAGARPRLLLKAEARALALYGTSLVYGDTVEDGVFMVPKTGGEPKRIARRSPISRTFAIDNEEICWVASPGDAVLRASLHTGAFPTTIRDRGIFADIAATRGDVYVNEVLGAGGALTRVTGATAARLVTFEGTPRGLAVDASHVYIVTPTKILKTPHLKGDVETIATGVNLEWPVAFGEQLFYVGELEGTRRRGLFAVSKKGGAATLLARDLRDAPIAVEGGEVVWFDGSRPQLRALALSDAKGPPRIVAEDDALATPSAIVLDATTAFVGTGSKEAGAIVTIARKP